MPIEVNLAKLSPTMDNGQLVKWLVKVGDPVKEGDTLAEVQTDKAVMPMESFEEGTVALLDVAEGDEIAVGQRVLVLAKKGEDPKEVAQKAGGSTAQPTQPAAAPQEAPAEENEESAHGTEREISNTPTRPEDYSSQGNGQQGRATEYEAAPGQRVKATPLARKIAAAANLDLRKVPPSGPDGRVVRRDVESYLKGGPAPAPTTSPASAPAPAPAHTPTPTAAPKAAPRPARARPAAAERTKLNRMRQAIARGMVEAKRNAPEIHVTVDVRVDEIVAIRERLNRQLAPEGVKLSMGDFVTKAVALALRRHPALNATFEGDNAKLAEAAIVLHPEVNIGLAVALDEGLIVPVLRDVDVLGLREIRTESARLFEAARQMRLTSEQMTGATFTISNLGMYGVRQFDAVLSLPQVAILAVAAAEKRPIVVGDSLAIGTLMTLTLTADHRAVDGATAADFLRTLKGLLEEPASMLL